MKRLLSIAVILSLACCLPAAVASGGGNNGQIPDGETKLKKKPAWVDDATVGGTVKGAVLTWEAGADRDTQRKARKDATDKLRTTFKLPETAKVKDMDTWTDESGATFIHLVAR